MTLSNTKKLIIVATLFILISVGVDFNLGSFVLKNLNSVTADDLRLDDQEATIRAIKKVMPAVVSIIIYDEEEIITINLRTGQRTAQMQRVQKGQGTGFLISADGLIVTNKHVVNAVQESSGSYRIILNSGKQYFAQLIGKDPLKDLAVLKIFDKNLPFVELGNSDDLQVGTTVIAIGNALGLYQNSVTKGIVSALGRSLVASDQAGNVEVLDNIIQTDAEINLGNSGGPLIDLTGKVIGINTAIDLSGSAIGFAIAVNDVRPVIKSVREIGRIVRAILGVRYIMLTPEIAIENNLPRSSGALIVDGDDGSSGILPNLSAANAGLQTGDIIFEINAIKIEGNNTLFAVVQKYRPGDRIGMKVQRGNKVMIKIITLDEFK